MSGKHADAELQLDVDVMILDYLMYTATTALLEEANTQMQRNSRNGNDAKRHHNHLAVDQPDEEDSNANDNSAEPSLTISMVDSFLRSFQFRHPSACVAKSLKLRLKLLRLTCLFTFRLGRCESTPSREELKELRRANRKRAEKFNSSSSTMSLGGKRKRKRDSSSVTAFTTASILAHTNNAGSVQGLPFAEETLQQNRELALKILLTSTSSSASIPPTSSSSPPSSLSSSLSSPSYLSTATSLKPFYGTPDSVSLLDLLPFFVSTSAARANLGHEAEEFVVQPRWMELAAEWMLQAVLEQYRIFGAEGADVIEEAFAWGYSRAIDDEGKGESDRKELKGEGEESCEVDYEEEWMTNVIFARDIDGTKELNRDEDMVSPRADGGNDDDDDGDGATYCTKRVENEIWTHLKREYIHKLQPPNDVSTNTTTFQQHLDTLSRQHPIYDFQSDILSFLSSVAASLAPPTLTQIETGRLHGLSEREMAEFKRRVGLAA